MTISECPTVQRSLNAIVQALVIEYGPRVGKYLYEQILRDKSKNIAFLKAMDEGLGVDEAARKIFGNQLDLLIEEANRPRKLQYKGLNAEYQRMDVDDRLDRKQKIELLEAELALNLETLEPDTMQSEEILNKARMIFDEWVKHYQEALSPAQSQREQLKDLRKILDSDVTTAADVFRYLKPVFGAASALTLIYVAMLATATGLGVWASITIFLGGIPGMQVIGFTSLAVLLAYLALIRVKPEDKIQTTIDGVYHLLADETEREQRLKELDKYLRANKDKAMLTAIILKHMIMIDEKEDEQEKTVFLDFFRDNYAMPDEEARKLYDAALKLEYPDEFLANMRAELSETDVMEVMKALKAIAVADGAHHPKEAKLILEVERQLGVQ